MPEVKKPLLLAFKGQQVNFSKPGDAETNARAVTTLERFPSCKVASALNASPNSYEFKEQPGSRTQCTTFIPLPPITEIFTRQEWNLLSMGGGAADLVIARSRP